MTNDYWIDLTILTLGAIIVSLWIGWNDYDQESRKK